MLKWSNLSLISLSSRSRTDPRRIFRALLPGRNWLLSLYSKWVKLFSLQVLFQNKGHEISYSHLNQVHMFTKFVKGQGTHRSKALFIWRQVVPCKRDTRLPARGTLRELDCKTVGFFLKISKEIGKAPYVWGTRKKNHPFPVSLSIFSLVPDLLFDCSRLLKYVKIRTVLQSISQPTFNKFAYKTWQTVNEIFRSLLNVDAMCLGLTQS